MSLAEGEWLDVCLRRVQARNDKETRPFVGIYSAYGKVWEEHRQLRLQQSELRRQLQTLQHESSEELAASGALTEASAAMSVIEKMKSKLGFIQNGLRDQENKKKVDQRAQLDLLHKVHEQSLAIANQAEELTICKEELANSREHSLRLQGEIEAEKESLDLVKRELESVRALVDNAERKARAFEVENDKLLQRILTEKAKTAEDLNEMNTMVDGLRSSAIFRGASSFFKSTVATVEEVSSRLLSGESSSGGGGVAKGGGGERRRGSGAASATGGGGGGGGGGGEEALLPVLPPLEVRIPTTASLTFQAHSTEINDIALDVSGKVIITGGADCVCRVSSNSGAERNSLLSSSPILSVACAGYGSESGAYTQIFAMSGSTDGKARIWDCTSGALKHELTIPNCKIFALEFIGKSGSRCIAAGSDRTIRVFDLRGSNSRAEASIKTSSCVYSVDVSPDHGTIASGHQDGSVRFWDPNGSQTSHILPKLHAGAITSVQYHPGTGQQLLTASRDNTLLLIETRTGGPILTCRSPGFRISSDWSRASFSPDGSLIAAGSQDGHVLVWSAIDGSVKSTLTGGHEVPVASVAWGRIGLVSADKEGKVVVWR